MKLVLSHDTALEYLRSTSAERSSRPQASRSLVAGCCADYEQALRLGKSCGLSLPVHLLVDRLEKRPSTGWAVYHTRNAPLPQGSLLHADTELFVASPELCFTQLAASHPLPDQVSIGHELCGSYRIGKGYDLPPLTTVAKLKAYAQRAAGMDGIVQTRRALRYVLPDSASSMETTLAMLLDLPAMMGGNSLSFPQLNKRIDPTRRTRSLASQSFYKCDLYWEKAHLAVEYESNLCHTGAHRLSKDSKRRDELTAMGVTVITVTASQVYNLREFDKLARVIARHLGERLPKRDKKFTERQLELRAILLGPCKPRT